MGISGCKRSAMECRKEENVKNCTCKGECERKGKCCECVLHHKQKGSLPHCLRKQ